jgi:hypothetical protein
MRRDHPDTKAQIDKWWGKVSLLPPLRLAEIVGRTFIAGGLISLLIYVTGEIHHAADYYGFYDVAGATILIGIGMGILIIRWIPAE